MEWTKPQVGSDSTVTPVERIGFDVIRAIVSARTANSPTVQAMVQRAARATGTGTGTAAFPGVSTIDLLNGRGPPNGVASIGAFCPVAHTGGEYR
ncbi:MAG: hypothetical protein ABL874_02330 [Sphingopyxis sp.]